jgi:hypothetical protein
MFYKGYGIEKSKGDGESNCNQNETVEIYEVLNKDQKEKPSQIRYLKISFDSVDDAKDYIDRHFN